jgi:large-conductance mechanosensitive channel
MMRGANVVRLGVSVAICTDVSALLNSLVEEVSEIAGPVIQSSANRRQKHSNS